MDYFKISPHKIDVKTINKSPINKYPIKVCVIGAFENKNSDNILLANAFEQIDGVEEVIRYDYRKRLKEEGSNITFSIRTFTYKADLTIICKGNHLFKEAYVKATHCSRTIYWMMDVFTHFKSNKGLLDCTKHCDYRTATGYDTAELMMKNTGLPVYQVINGADTSVYHPEKHEKIYDVSFIGGADNERLKIRNHLKNSGININFVGPKFTRYVPPDEFRKICNQSKIVLNISRGSYKGYSSIRVWNTMACGAFVITKTIPEMSKYLGLTIGKELAEYENMDDLLHKIKWYLANDKKREELAQNGLNFVKNNMTWKHTAERFMQLAYNEDGCHV